MATSTAGQSSAIPVLAPATLNVGGHVLRARKPAPPLAPPRKSAKAKGKERAVAPELSADADQAAPAETASHQPTRWFTHSAPNDEWRAYSSRPARGSASMPRRATKPRATAPSTSAKIDPERAAPTRRSARLRASTAPAVDSGPGTVVQPSSTRTAEAAPRPLVLCIPGRTRSSSRSATVVDDSDATAVARSSSEDLVVAGPSRKALGKRRARSHELDDIEEERDREDAPREAKRARVEQPEADAALLLALS